MHDVSFELPASTELTNAHQLTVLEMSSFSLISDPQNQSEKVLIKLPEEIKFGSDKIGFPRRFVEETF